MDFVASFLGRNGFLPHGTCFTWSPAVLWTMVGSDLAIAAAYFSIPLAIGRFVRQRADPAMNVKVAWLFSTFIFACGVTHVAHVWTVWFPDYGWEALTKLFTASVSVVTAFALWPLLPKAIALPKVGELQAVIAQLQAEAARRRSAEEHLLDSENALAVTLASIDAGFIVTDREGHVTQMNSVAEQLTGWPRSEALGRALWDVFVREDRPAEYLHQSPVDVMLQQDLSVETAHHVVAIARDGRRTAVEVKANVTYNEDGSVRGLVMVTRDLTAALKAQAESSRLAAVVSSSQDAIITKTLDGRITSWNAAATRLFGYTEDEALGQPIQILMPDERKAEELRIIALVAHGEHVPPFDTVRRARDGQLKEVSVSVSPLRDREGRIVGASKIARDILEHHRALRSLRESRERLDFILDAAQIGDWELDFQTQTIKRSLRHDRCFGYETLQAEWTVQLLLAHVHDEDRAGTALALQRAIATGAPLRLTCRVLWPDQSVHWVGMQGAMKSTDDTRASMLGIVMDITESKQAEQARLSAQHLEAELRQVQATSRVKSQFLTNMSHELRTPLNAIIGFSELLQSGMAEGKPAKQELFLKHIADSGHHLLHLINDLLDLSKVDAGKFTFNPDFVALPTLVADVVSALQPAVQQGKLRIDMAIDPAIGEVFIDPVRLRQVLYNLVSNAIKFTPAGGRVAIRAQVEADAWFRLEVEDTGVGIAATDMARMFSEFEQLNAGKARQQVGTGLGLALTRRLVEAQGGSVTLRSVVDQGTTFCVVLPRSAPGGQVLPTKHRRWRRMRRPAPSVCW